MAQQRLLEQYFAQSIKYQHDWPIVLSEGDSWFSFPGHWNTIDHLDDLLNHNVSLLRLEESGDTIANMIGGKQRGQLRRLLTTYPVDALLFSGGGNDVVGHELVDFFTNVPAGDSWPNYLTDAVEQQFRMLPEQQFDHGNTSAALPMRSGRTSSPASTQQDVSNRRDHIQHASATTTTVQSIGNGWWHCLDSTWIVKSELTAIAIRDRLLPHIDDNDELLVATVTRDVAWTGFDAQCSTWLKDNL